MPRLRVKQGGGSGIQREESGPMAEGCSQLPASDREPARE